MTNENSNFQKALADAKRYSTESRCLVYQVGSDSFVTTWTTLCSGVVVAAFEQGKRCSVPKEFNCRPEDQIEHIRDQIASAKQLQRNASQMRNATGVMNCQRELEGLYRQLDPLVPQRLSMLNSNMVHPAYAGR